MWKTGSCIIALFVKLTASSLIMLSLCCIPIDGYSEVQRPRSARLYINLSSDNLPADLFPPRQVN